MPDDLGVVRRPGKTCGGRRGSVSFKGGSKGLGAPVPFYGLQDVTRIELPREATEEEILNICRERCRSDHFVLVDEYKEIPDTFMLGAAMCAEDNVESTHGYRIFKKYP